MTLDVSTDVEDLKKWRYEICEKSPKQGPKLPRQNAGITPYNCDKSTYLVYVLSLAVILTLMDYYKRGRRVDGNLNWRVQNDPSHFVQRNFVGGL